MVPPSTLTTGVNAMPAELPKPSVAAFVMADWCEVALTAMPRTVCVVSVRSACVYVGVRTELTLMGLTRSPVRAVRPAPRPFASKRVPLPSM